MHRPSPFSSSRAARLLTAVLALSLASAALAQEEPAEPAPSEPAPSEPAAAEPAPAADAKPLSGVWRGRHRLSFVGGLHLGSAVRDAGIFAAPLTGQPGSRAYPAATPLRVELDDAPTFGLRWAWFAGDNWGIELGLSHVGSEIIDPESDLAADAIALETSNLSESQKQALLARLAAHQAPHDLDATFVDISAIHVFNPKKRFPVEVGGGLGWAFSSLDGPVAYERLVIGDIVREGDRAAVANEYPGSPYYPDSPPAFGTCIEPNDPCLELKAQGGLTWHAFMNFGYAFTPDFQLRMGARARFVEQLVDPGDSGVMTELTLGVAYSFGGN